jgi:hypothetical protein
LTSAVAATIAIGILAGCSASNGGPATLPSSITMNPDHGRSWMAPAAKKSKELLYISDTGTDDVYVYSYPNLAAVGTLTGFSDPNGMCVDKSGDVFVVNYGASDIVEYAHGGLTPIATLNDPGYSPEGCSIDPTTGNLAVTNWTTTSSGSGDVVIYKGATGSQQTYYGDPAMFYMAFCSFDDKGNLFVDGYGPGPSYGDALAELPSGGASFKNIELQLPPNSSMLGVQWDGSHVAIGDWDGGKYADVIYQFAIAHKKAKLAGSTSLTGSEYIRQFWIAGTNVIGPDIDMKDVGIWNYPAGGAPIATLTGFSSPVGSVVSRAK